MKRECIPSIGEAAKHGGWRARLELEYGRRGGRTALLRRMHSGPLVVQKALYPEGGQICHTIVLHPPGGIAGGDELEIDVRVGASSHALLTTPGAGKWYRSGGPLARLSTKLVVASGAALEWLPQETIFFDGVRAEIATRVQLDATARFIGWDILCFGRSGSGERFAKGSIGLASRIEVEGRPLFVERAVLEGGSAWLNSPAGLAGQPVSGTLVAFGAQFDASLLARCREIAPATGSGGVTLVSRALVCRYLGSSSEAGREWLVRMWQLLRPLVLGREAQLPRIWRT